MSSGETASGMEPTKREARPIVYPRVNRVDGGEYGCRASNGVDILPGHAQMQWMMNMMAKELITGKRDRASAVMICRGRAAFESNAHARDRLVRGGTDSVRTRTKRQGEKERGREGKSKRETKNAQARWK